LPGFLDQQRGKDMIEVSHLTKRYGQFTAVDDLSFKVEDGTILGFLGPNGAGKTTTMRLLAGFLTPTQGQVSVNGHDVVEDSFAARREIGYLPEGAPSYGEMTVRDFLAFIADVRGLTGARRQQRMDYVIEHLHLAPVLNKTIDTLSKGFKRRVGVAQAIIHDPAVLIMDEPTDGLDPNQKHEVRRLIKVMAPGKIIIVSTHILEEVHAVCSRAMIIAAGRLLADDTPAALTARSRFHNAISLRTSTVSEVMAGLKTLKEVASVEHDSETDLVTAFPKSGKNLFEPVSAMMKARDWPIASMHVEDGRLDDVFREITSSASREAA